MIAKAQRFYLNHGCKVQKLTKKLHYAVDDTNFYSVPFEGGTGLKVMMGGIKDDKALICFDLDCKGDSSKGKGIMEAMIGMFRDLMTTMIEQTKSGGFHIFYKVDKDLVKDYYKVVFDSFFYHDDVAMEVFMNAPITVAPTKSLKGDYRIVKRAKIKELTTEEYHTLMKFLNVNSVSYSVNSLSSGYDKEVVKIDDRDLLNTIEILKRNDIRFRATNKQVSVWDDADKSSSGDWIVNKNQMLWNLKTHERIGVKEWIIRERGTYKEREIRW